ncbi:MAG: PQQ-binding-like beta-propeller repeat protein, partial [Planctomycetota bacterium]
MIRIFLVTLPLVLVLQCGSINANDWSGFGGPHANHRVDIESSRGWTPGIAWSLALGEGRSGIVTDGQVAFVSYLEPFSQAEQKQPIEKRVHRESVAAIDVRSGKRLWRSTYEAGYRESQETFGGRLRAPQSTPLLIRDSAGRRKLVTVGFSGIVKAFDCETGDVAWSIDLVKRFNAVPVQFGFSSSPINVDGQIVLLAGGDRGGLVALDPIDGSLKWNVACGEASYATPVVAEFGGTRHIIFVTRNRVLSVNERGELLWETPIQTAGLTNVPTPIVVSDGIVLSGQGFGGTVRWTVQQDDGNWQVSERWASDQQFFYCNWVASENQLFGCTGNLLVALDLESGETLKKRRGYAESNLAMAGQMLLVTHGKDGLSRLRFVDNEFEPIESWQLDQGRCWTPASWFGDNCLVRSGETVFAIGLQQDASSDRLLAQAGKTSTTNGPGHSTDDVAMDAVQKVIAVYQRDGADAAMQVYDRERKAQSLSLAQRMRLAELAHEIEESSLAARIVGEAFEDAGSEDGRRKLKDWLIGSIQVVKPNEKSSSLGKNGLPYLKIALLNLAATR